MSTLAPATGRPAPPLANIPCCSKHKSGSVGDVDRLPVLAQTGHDVDAHAAVERGCSRTTAVALLGGVLQRKRRSRYWPSGSNGADLH